MVDGISFEPAIAADNDLVSDIILGEPGQLTRQVGMRVFGIDDPKETVTLWRRINRQAEAWRLVTLAKSDGDTVGVLLAPGLEVSIGPGLLARGMLLFGPRWLAGLPGRMRLQSRVGTDRIDGAYNIGELHVDASARGQGVGSALLVEAERQARAAGHEKMTLQTLVSNPATRLYERFGFKTTQIRTDPGFEALTGAPGNQRMVKSLR